MMIRSWIKGLRTHWQEWDVRQKLGAVGTVLAIIASLYAGTSFFIDLTKDKKEKIIVFAKKVHLGDNDQARFGGGETPLLENPGGEEGSYLLVFDKENRSFQSNFGFPTEVQNIAYFFGKRYIETNLSAYKHVKGISTSEVHKDRYLGQSVIIDSFTRLVWEENRGAFYHERAAVGISRTINLFQVLKDKGYEPSDISIKKAVFWYHGLHSGRRPDQNENVELVVNGKTYPLRFDSLDVRQEELVPVNLDPKTLSLARSKTNRFTLMVLPYQETYPIPTQGSGYELRGPGHFRDIELWEGFIELVID